MTYVPVVNNRVGFTDHASPAAISAALGRAREAQRAAAAEIVWLERLRESRATQIRNGTWPLVPDYAPTEALWVVMEYDDAGEGTALHGPFPSEEAARAYGEAQAAEWEQAYEWDVLALADNAAGPRHYP